MEDDGLMVVIEDMVGVFAVRMRVAEETYSILEDNKSDPESFGMTEC